MALTEKEKLERLISYLYQAIAAYKRGSYKYGSRTYTELSDAEREIMREETKAECTECGKCLNNAVDMDQEYKAVYDFFSTEGIKNNSFLGEDVFCQGKIVFVRARLADLKRLLAASEKQNTIDQLHIDLLEIVRKEAQITDQDIGEFKKVLEDYREICK